MGFRATCIFILVFTGLHLVALASAEQVETLTIMRGTPHETTCTIKRGDTPGPTVFIIGGMHGDETAGYLAARKLRNWTVTTGTLILIPDSHVTAIRANKREHPANMNRQFPGKANGTAMQRAAAEIWALIKQYRPALLVTLHESVGLYRDNPQRFGQTLTFDTPELEPVFRPVLDEINQHLPNPRERFLTKLYPCRGSPTDSAWRFLKIPAVTVETTRTMKLEERVRQQLLVCAILMARWGLEWETEAAPVASGPQAPAVRPDVSRLRDHVAYLASTVGPRLAGSAAERKALEYCRAQLAAMGYAPQVQPVPLWDGLTTQNVIATSPGSGKPVVIGAHADSVGWSPGANDNASGVALTLELAQHLAQYPLPYPIRFIIFGAEEGRYANGRCVSGTGRAGSRYYVRNLTEAQRREIRLMINLDQVGAGPGLRAGDMDEPQGPAAGQALSVARSFRIPINIARFAGKSDYRPFRDRAIPILCFDCGPDPLTHRAADTPSRLDMEKMTALYQVIVGFLGTLGVQ